MRPTVKSEWGRSGKVEVEYIPNLDVRQTEMHRNNFNQPICCIENQRIHTGFRYLSRQMLKCRLNYASRHFPNSLSLNIQTIQLRYRAQSLRYRTTRAFTFAK